MPAVPHTVLTLEEFKSHLRRHGLKATRQRLAVHEVMIELGHASPDAVCAALKEKGTHVTTASVYNILSQLADAHIYSRRLSATNKMFFDSNATRHIHLYDRENHTYREVSDDQLLALVTQHLKHRKFKGYSVEDIDIQLIARPTRKNKSL